jgi:hypothetical protein
VAFWILSCLDASGNRGDERLVWLCYAALNIGVVLAALHDCVRRERQLNRECRARAHVAGHIRPTAMRFGDKFDDWQAQPGAAALSRANRVHSIVAIPEMGEMLRRDARPVIGDNELCGTAG